MLFFHINKKIGLADKIIRAEKAALNFIISNVNTRGGWSDFRTNRSGESTAWVTAYILNSSGVLLPNKIRERASKFLLSERNGDGFWGFSKNIPSDLDSTIHALLMLYKQNLFLDKEVTDYIKSYQKDSGGFATYLNGYNLSNYRRANVNENFQGWLNEHICVTALTLEFLSFAKINYDNEDFERAFQYLLDEQSTLGYWKSYWWHSNYYSTDIIVRLLNDKNKNSYKDHINKGLRYILSSWNPDGWWDNGINRNEPCFISTCRCLNSLIHFNDHNDYDNIIEKTIIMILDQQNVNGSWQNNPILRIPKPSVIKPEEVTDWEIGGKGVGSICCDNNNLYTTASILNIFRKIN